MLLLISAALAQDADTFDFSGSAFDDQGSLQLTHPKLGLHKAWYTGVGVVYADDPLVLVFPDGREEKVVSRQFSTRVHGGVTLGETARLDVILPVYPSVVVDGTSSFTLGDVALGALIPVVEKGTETDSFAFALKPTIWIPSGDPDAFVTTGSFRGGLIAAVGGRSNALSWRVNLGFDVGRKTTLEELEFGTAFDAGAGVTYHVNEDVHVGAEVTSVVTLTGGTAWNKNPVEGHVYTGWTHGSGFGVDLGLGTGIIAGIGAPDYRVALGLTYRNPGTGMDRDKDGIVDGDDRCPDDPEDLDNFQDTDGCPDTDNDADGLLDVDDGCPNDPEDKDGFEDSDGCPDLDNDQDSVADVEDECPNDPGDPELAGCPNMDGDALADKDDQCPEEPGPLATKGCPDRDGDLVPDFRDDCPDEAGPEGADPRRSNGCPSKIVVTKEAIVILDKVYFNTNKATIKKVSHEILDGVAQVMLDHPDILLVEVAGHTDSDGSDESNLDLSQRRAEPVRDYLIGRGVDPDRLVAKGYGEEVPIDTNKTNQGKAKNRRVEFTMLEQEGVGEEIEIEVEAPE